ncbi:MAG: lamin tail domain-containing protein [Phycisphaerae bacterium]|nr:lamin tail domain-containing protein [Phycisphaerae bacterium]
MLLACPATADTLVGDLNASGEVNIEDLLILVGQWLDGPDCTSHPADCADLIGNDSVNLADFGLISKNWLKQGDPPVPNLKINEFMSSNYSTIDNDEGDFDDWIEIYNAGDEAIDVGGMYLTDNLSDPMKWQIPGDSPNETTIGSHDYLLIWADGQPDEGPLHVDFQLENTGEEIGLFASNGSTLLDSVVYGQQVTDISFGRYPNADNYWHFYGSPTPGKENTGIDYLGLVAQPEFSVRRGFYQDEFDVTITCPTEGSNIRYTLNGSVPTPLNGMDYIPGEGVRIDSTTCLRAGAFKTDWLPGNVDTHTYIFVSDVISQSPNGEKPGVEWPNAGTSTNGQLMDYGMDPDIVNDDPRYIDLVDDALLTIPTFSLVTDLDNLFDASTGIYVNAMEDGSQWERSTSLELINPDGSKGFQIDAGLRIRGGSSRNDNSPKHSFRLLFRSIYGAGTLNYPLFEDEGADEFDKIDLRTSQNYSWAKDGNSGNTMLQDVFSRDTQKAMGQHYTRSRY